MQKPIMTNRITSLAVLLLITTVSAFGQKSYTIADEQITTCQASFLDTGGESQNPYGNNESFTATICANDGESSISLNFVTFDLSTAGTAPLDQMTIYDGNDTNAPLIGTYTGTSSPGIVSASFENTSGCITVVWSSNETGVGNFAAFVTCYEPCEPPLAVASMVGLPTIPALVCQNEVITFDASASTAADGFSIAEYKWDFDDGVVDSLTGAIVEHSFAIPGEYLVQVYLTDDNDCNSTNLVDLQILVSTTPSFAATAIADTVICQGQTVILDATGVVPTEWSAVPQADFGEGIYLPDDQSEGFSSTLTYTGFSPGGIVDSMDDILAICVNMEHSFMGDLVIGITCPNGQTVTFHEQGGGGTFIGGALDGETTPPTPGECWEYCWSPTATNGTWAENSGGTIPSGTYESVQPMTQLIGCPLNGTWTINIADLWGADDGFLCSWFINFDPDLYPELTTYTPNLGLSTLDSSFWSGPEVVTDPNTPLIAIVTPTEPGVYEYVFTVTDDFGCQYDSSMTVTVNPSPQAPILITGNNTYCEGGITFLNAPPGFDSYVWSNASVGPNISATEGTYTVTVAYGSCPLLSEPFVVTELPSPTPQITGPGFSCGGDPAELSTTEAYESYQWSSGGTGPTESVVTGTYTVTVTNSDNCSGTSDPFTVTLGSDPQALFGTDPVSPQPIGTTVSFNDASQGNGSPITDWSWDFGIFGSGSSIPSPSFQYQNPGTYQVVLTITTADGCESSYAYSYTIYPEDVIIPNVFSPNGDGSNDLFVIENGEFTRNRLEIYNRWGQIVYEAKDYRNSWRANDVPDGTYYYVFTLDSGKDYSGHVTILR
jgi:gliding motility-associated-like protein